MFNLEQAIAGWRRQMNADGLKSAAVLDELESYLREEVERQARAGADEKVAFCAAIEQLGQPQALTTEFAKIGETNDMVARIKDFFLTLAGIPNASLATNMNSSSPNTNIEPAWATYVKSGAFMFPATLVGMFVLVFIFPKFKQICEQGGVAMPGIYGLVLALTEHAFLVCSAIIAVLALLEWRNKSWPRYRRAVFGVGVFTVNFAVMALVTSMVVFAIIAAVELSRHVK
jgi:hypothetical protein